MSVVYIDHSGEEVEGFAPGMEYRAIAKKITGEELVRHYIYRANGRLVDPKQLNPRQLKNLNKQLVPVSEFVYELYLLDRVKFFGVIIWMLFSSTHFIFTPMLSKISISRNIS